MRRLQRVMRHRANAADPRPVGPAAALADIPRRFPILANFVEDVADLDVPETRIARGWALTILPSTTPYVIVQYRTPTTSVRRFGELVIPHQPYRHIVTTVQTGVVTILPRDPVGTIVVRLKPEAAAGLLGHNHHEFVDRKIELGSVFDAVAVNSLVEAVAAARSSYERQVTVLRFLSAKLLPHEPDPIVRRAAARLRSNPSLRVGLLAAQLGVSERHLSRKFKSVFGTGPKSFARIARVERALASGRRGLDWADVACACGFTDQAHMVHDFNTIVGAAPDHFFRRVSSIGRAQSGQLTHQLYGIADERAGVVTL
jgi:AraC-like DNA-binding protein